MEETILAELKANKERVIAIIMQDKGYTDEEGWHSTPGIKGTINSFDCANVEILTSSGKLLVLPRSAYLFRRVEKEAKR